MSGAILSRGLAVGVSFVLTFACAARRPTGPDPLVTSHAELRAGCYRCLEAALAAIDHRADVAARGRRFELTVLLAIRAKELGLPFELWRQRAAALAPRLPPEWSAANFLAVVDAVPLDPFGFDRNATFRPRRPDVALMRAAIAAIQQTPASNEVKGYLEVTVTCAFDFEQRDVVLGRIRPAAEGIPLLAYAVGLCSRGELRLLTRAMTDEPRFADAAYPAAKYLFEPPATTGADPDPAALLARAGAAFPESAAITYSAASLHRQRRRWLEALAAFVATLGIVPTHHDARLGRVMALSHLARHEEAIAAATGLIDEGRWLVGDAYYWRAWNAFQLDRLDESERDVERAKNYIASSSVYVLSGAVQWRKQRPKQAESEFLRAVAIDRADCDASTYLGGVRAELLAWKTAGEAFTVAETCRDQEAAELRKSLEELLQRNAPPAAVDEQRRSIATAEQQSAEMAYNRGVMAANAGDNATARAHLERASRNPALQQKAQEMLQRVHK
jgi:tetratricopeptide (TPR) repeat protein